MLETALNEEMTEHLGHAKHLAAVGRDSTNVRNGMRSKTVLTEATGKDGIEVPRDREGTFEPQIVKKRQRRLTGVDEIVLSLYAKGLDRIFMRATSRTVSCSLLSSIIIRISKWSYTVRHELLYRNLSSAPSSTTGIMSPND